jgi:hypothetical protein
MTPAQTIQRQLRALRSEMKVAGVKKTSCFNGGLDRETYRYNARRFELETNLATAKVAAAEILRS